MKFRRDADVLANACSRADQIQGHYRGCTIAWETLIAREDQDSPIESDHTTQLH